jgi:hypothetical protein
MLGGLLKAKIAAAESSIILVKLSEFFLTISVKICHPGNPTNLSQTVNPGDRAYQTIPALPGFVCTGIDVPFRSAS